MKHLLLLVLLLAVIALQAQAPSINGQIIYSCYHVGATTAWTCKYAAVDPPLTLTLDSTGNPHLGIDFSKVLSVPTFDANTGYVTLQVQYLP